MSKKILIIDDNAASRLLMGDILKYHGYEIIEADNGETGMSLIVESKPDLILLDMQMPDMDGFSVLDKMKSNPELRDIKIIAVTSYAMKGDRDRILGMGVDEYISKPINTVIFFELVNKIIG